METSFLEQLLFILGVPAAKCTVTYKHLHRVLNQGHWRGRSALTTRSPNCVITGLSTLVAAMNTFRARQ